MFQKQEGRRQNTVSKGQMRKEDHAGLGKDAGQFQEARRR